MTSHIYFSSQVEYMSLIDDAAQAIIDLPESAFDRYDNPFEQKFALREKFDLPDPLDELIDDMEYMPIHRAFSEYIKPDITRHYCGVFKYMPGDHLSVHVDAGLHPETSLRKYATAIVYLGEGAGDFQLWEGTSCAGPQPVVWKLFERFHPHHGKLVIFQNNDRAWHGAAVNNSSEPRLVVTVSYMTENLNRFENPRRRAYFVPRPGENWEESLFKLRDLRASEDHYSEAYRV